MNLVAAFLEQVKCRPEAAALVLPSGAAVSYAALSRDSAAYARTLQASGVGQGDRVLIARGVSRELYATLIGVFRIGAVAVFPEPAAGLAGVDHAVAVTQPKLVATGWKGRLVRWCRPSLWRLPVLGAPDFSATGEPLLPIDDEQPALITFTSGSTGKPKGIVRSSGFLMLQHRLLEQLRHTEPGDTDLISLPVFVLSNLAAGATSVIPAGPLTRPARLNGEELRGQIGRHGCNRMVAPPAVCRRVADGGAGCLASLDAIFTGGGPVFPNLLHDLRRAAPRAAIHAVYGSTEAEPIAHIRYNDISDDDWAAMAAGKGLLAGLPISEIRTRLVDHELWVAGEHVNRGYLDDADNASTKVIDDGGTCWHRTGDAARIDAQGRLWLLGRVSASRDGLFPFAIETAALSWPGVRQAALLADHEPPLLAVAGEDLDHADLADRAQALGVQLRELRRIPMDKRHNSKVDYPRLRQLLN